MRSTAARRSSSEMRVNSPSTTMSLTVEQAARLDAAQRADGEQCRRFHLDREHAALRPALVLPLVRVVEDVARDDRPDVQVLAELLRRVHRAVDDRPRRRRAVRLVADEVHRGRVRGHRGQRDDQVAELMVRLETAAGADADQLLAAELDQLLEDDRRARAAHPGALHGDRLALVRARVAEQPALAVSLHDVVEVRLGDVLGAKRVAGEENRLCVLPRLGANVDRHGAPTL